MFCNILKAGNIMIWNRLLYKLKIIFVQTLNQTNSFFCTPCLVCIYTTLPPPPPRPPPRPPPPRRITPPRSIRPPSLSPR